MPLRLLLLLPPPPPLLHLLSFDEQVDWNYIAAGRSVPKLDGIVVCSEFQDLLIEAWEQEQQRLEQERLQRRQKRAIANWRKLTRGEDRLAEREPSFLLLTNSFHFLVTANKGLLIRAALQAKYGDHVDESAISHPSSSSASPVQGIPKSKNTTTTMAVTTGLHVQSVKNPTMACKGKSEFYIVGFMQSIYSSSFSSFFADHEHQYVENYNPTNKQWNKECTCGLSIPFEKM